MIFSVNVAAKSWQYSWNKWVRKHHFFYKLTNYSYCDHMIISVNVAETNGSTPSLSSLFAVTSTRINISKFHEIRRSKQRFFEQTSHTLITWSSYVQEAQTMVNGLRFQWMYFIIFLRLCSICSTSKQGSFLTKISWPSPHSWFDSITKHFRYMSWAA